MFLLFTGAEFSAVPVSKIKERVEKTGKLRFKSDPEIRTLQGQEFKAYINTYFKSLYPEKNAENGPGTGVISVDYSPTAIVVIPTNEELQIAIDTYNMI